jgi:hypothetical protein
VVLRKKYFWSGQIKNPTSDIIQTMNKKELKTPTVTEKNRRRREVWEKSEEFRRRIEAIYIPEVVRAKQM